MPRTKQIWNNYIASGRVNEPSGLTVIYNDPMTAEYAYGLGENRTDTNDPVSPRSSSRGNIFTGNPSSTDMNVYAEWNFSAKRTLYSETYMRISDPFPWHTSETKLLHLYTQSGIDAGNHRTIITAGNGSGEATVHREWPSQKIWGRQDSPGGAGVVAGGPFYYPLGEWFKLEHLMGANTSGNDDGICKLWINGTLCVSASTYRWDDLGLGIVRFLFNPFWGGGGGACAFNGWAEVGNVYLSGAA